MFGWVDRALRGAEGDLGPWLGLRKGVSVSGFAAQVAFAKKVLWLLENEGPRDRDGELSGRWRTWASVLRRDLRHVEIMPKTEERKGVFEDGRHYEPGAVSDEHDR